MVFSARDTLSPRRGDSLLHCISPNIQFVNLKLEKSTLAGPQAPPSFRDQPDSRLISIPRFGSRQARMLSLRVQQKCLRNKCPVLASLCNTLHPLDHATLLMVRSSVCRCCDSFSPSPAGKSSGLVRRRSLTCQESSQIAASFTKVTASLTPDHSFHPRSRSNNSLSKPHKNRLPLSALPVLFSIAIIKNKTRPPNRSWR